MLKINLHPRAKKFLRKLPGKHEKQILTKIVLLAENPNQHDVEKLNGFSECRADVGECRIIFNADAEWLRIPLIGRRNDSDVYKKLRRLLGR